MGDFEWGSQGVHRPTKAYTAGEVDPKTTEKEKLGPQARHTADDVANKTGPHSARDD
jgi:hypothetical protein